MPCYQPRKGFQCEATGKLLFIERGQPGAWKKLTVPCGGCIGCKIDRSRAWAVRATHEAQMVEKAGGQNSFVTLTYDDANIPPGGSLKPKDLTFFFKRLRKVRPFSKIRYLACGEYGEKLQRPHYHAILFNCHFPDQELHAQRRGNKTYTSQELSRLWPYGFHEIGNVTWQSSAYVARYISKKINGEDAELHYVNKQTGDILEPEFLRCSRRPGLGSAFFDAHWRDMYPSDEVLIKQGNDLKRYSVPRYYDKLLERKAEEENSDELKQMIKDIKLKREQFAQYHPEEQTEQRLRDREKHKTLVTQRLNDRNLNNDS